MNLYPVAMLTRGRESCSDQDIVRPFAAPHSRRQPIRRPIDDFDLGLECRGGRSHDDASVELGRGLTFVFGEENQAVQTYELLLGYAPPRDLEALRERGAIIVMAPTIPDWLCSSQATQRRGQPLTDKEQARARREHGPGTGTAAVYDAQTDSLVLPTDEVSPDPLHPVLHELGHALTLDQVWMRFRDFKPLLDNLPQRILDHLATGYRQGKDDDAVRVQIAEVFAEAYAMAHAGRDDELPPTLASALVGILADMGQQESARGGRVDPQTGRTSTYAPPDTMIRESDPRKRVSRELPPLSRAGDRKLLDRRARHWPPDANSGR